MISNLRRRRRPPTLVSASEFQKKLTHEHLRLRRRHSPFCVVEISLGVSNDRDADGFTAGRVSVRDRHVVASVLHRQSRATDHKSEYSPGRFLWLLTDTPEMGGRLAIARMASVVSRRGIAVTTRLDVHDPDGFGEDGFGEDGFESSQSIDDEIGDLQIEAAVEFEPAGRRGVLTESTQSAPSLSPVGLTEASSTAVATRTPSVSLRHDSMDPSIDIATIYNPPAIAKRSVISGAAKRLIDIVGSTVGLIVLSPVIAAAVIAIRRGDGGPALFKQVREGRGGRAFTIYKLRTMSLDAESRQADLRSLSHRDGPAFKIADDPRITPVGHFLRKTCIDELPQLLNVLRGEMSLVGPRPLPWHESRACSQWQRRRLEIRPGMTCYWQIDKASVKTFDQWMRLDLMYLQRAGVVEDLRLILRTITVPMQGRGGE